MKLTRRGLLYILISTAFFLIASVNLIKPLFYLSALMVSLALASTIYCGLSLLNIRLERIPDTHGCFAGEEMPLRARIGNGAGRSASRLILRDGLAAPAGAPDALLLVEDVAPYEDLEVHYGQLMPRRGRYDDNRLRLEAVDPLGIVRMWRAAPEAGVQTVYPSVLPIASPSPGARYSRRIGNVISRLAPEGRETFSGVRDYHQGDELKRIHWRATARTGRVFVKEFEREALPVVKILLDIRSADSRGKTIPQATEDAITAAASLTAVLMRENVRVSLVVDGSADGIESAPLGRQRFYDTMTWMAALESGRGEPLQELAERLVLESEPGTNLYIISADPDPRLAEVLITARARKLFPVLLQIDASTYPARHRSRWRREYSSQRREQGSAVDHAGVGRVEVAGGFLKEALGELGGATALMSLRHDTPFMRQEGRT